MPRRLLLARFAPFLGVMLVAFVSPSEVATAQRSTGLRVVVTEAPARSLAYAPTLSTFAESQE